jgi:hypothetical protein
MRRRRIHGAVFCSFQAGLPDQPDECQDGHETSEAQERGTKESTGEERTAEQE